MSKKTLFEAVSLLLALLAVIFVFGCSESPSGAKKGNPDELIVDLSSVEKALVQSDNRFGFKLFNEIVKEEEDKNVFISPLSVAMALGMTYNGASGETQKAMQQTLELNGLSLEEVNQSYKHLIELLTSLDPKVKFQIANSIWYRLGVPFKSGFIDLCKKYFTALVTSLDFADPKAAKTINGWVDENTNGKIKEIVDSPIDPAMVMFLINAIYFKGTWTYQFEEKETRDDLFNLPDGTRKSCKMMKREGTFRYLANADFQAVDLPYGDGDFSMTVFLPHPNKDIDLLITEFNQENWGKWINGFSEQDLTLQFPRFTLEYEVKLKAILATLGMEVAFDPGQADFTRMYEGSERVYINQVKHKTFVQVNEEGTEAAAVTSVEMMVTSVGLWMKVDRPFVFVIRENQSQTILFVGKIVDPGYE
jgi:serpin B